MIIYIHISSILNIINPYGAFDYENIEESIN